MYRSNATFVSSSRRGAGTPDRWRAKAPRPKPASVRQRTRPRRARPLDLDSVGWLMSALYAAINRLRYSQAAGGNGSISIASSGIARLLERDVPILQGAESNPVGS